jgi:hypothetical protein
VLLLGGLACFFFSLWFALWASRTWPERIFKGIITRAASRVMRCSRFYARMGVWLAGAVVMWPLHDPWWWYGGSAWYILLYLDDIVNGDEDRWKRWREAVKNRVKWRTWHPVRKPLTVPS